MISFYTLLKHRKSKGNPKQVEDDNKNKSRNILSRGHKQNQRLVLYKEQQN